MSDTTQNTCQHALLTGPRKGQACGKPCGGKFCSDHAKRHEAQAPPPPPASEPEAGGVDPSEAAEAEPGAQEPDQSSGAEEAAEPPSAKEQARARLEERKGRRRFDLKDATTTWRPAEEDISREVIRNLTYVVYEGILPGDYVWLDPRVFAATKPENHAQLASREESDRIMADLVGFGFPDVPNLLFSVSQRYMAGTHELDEMLEPLRINIPPAGTLQSATNGAVESAPSNPKPGRRKRLGRRHKGGDTQSDQERMLETARRFIADADANPQVDLNTEYLRVLLRGAYPNVDNDAIEAVVKTAEEE